MVVQRKDTKMAIKQLMPLWGERAPGASTNVTTVEKWKVTEHYVFFLLDLWQLKELRDEGKKMNHKVRGKGKMEGQGRKKNTLLRSLFIDQATVPSFALSFKPANASDSMLDAGTSSKDGQVIMRSRTGHACGLSPIFFVDLFF